MKDNRTLTAAEIEFVIASYDLKFGIESLVMMDNALYRARAKAYHANATPEQKSNDLIDNLFGQTTPDFGSLDIAPFNVTLSDMFAEVYSDRRTRLAYMIEALGILNGVVDRETKEVCDDEWSTVENEIRMHLDHLVLLCKIKKIHLLGAGNDWNTKEFGNYHLGFRIITPEETSEPCSVMFTIWSNLTVRECQKTRVFIIKP
jgi:hypothetical protein